MKHTNPIIGITLEGFQVFDKPTYIPFERLTLLFGPNSAGKSAVQDAIELYVTLLNSNEFSWTTAGLRVPLENLYGSRSGLGVENISDLENRHWRRIGGLNGKRVEKMSLCVTRTISPDLDVDIARELGRKPIKEGVSSRHSQSESRWVFYRDEADDYAGYEFEFYIDSELFVAHSGVSLCVNLEHPIIQRIEKKLDFNEVARTCPNEVTFEQGLFTLKTGILGFHPAGRGSLKKGPNWLQDDRNGGWSADKETDMYRAAKNEISLLVGYTLLISQDQGFISFQSDKVSASRTIPSRIDLTFEIGDFEDPKQRILPVGDMTYEELANSLLTSQDCQHAPKKDPLSFQKTYATNINRALTDHLFLEQGYRVDLDFRVLMSTEQSRLAVEGKELNLNEFVYIVELFLRDGQGRKHLFEDVGSGIGYVLPVLCGIFGPYRSSFIQQPELHLHPALQAAMGDVFIEASSKGKQILIETHSEHLLLRILKRIRQTHLQAAMTPELKIEADDVCVLYFDPSPDGTTTVKRLRITEDGEFMDRWPRGFFGERDQELLDE